MKLIKVCLLAMGIICLMPLAVYAEKSLLLPNEQVTDQSVLKEGTILCYFTDKGKILEHREGSKYYRKLLKINSDKSYIIQDFYSNSDKKQVDPVTFKSIINLKAWNNQQIGIIEGRYIQWYENGQKQTETTYVNGKKHGLSTDWYESGSKKLEMPYQDDQINGLLRGWYENGKLKFEAGFVKGINNGVFKAWYSSGAKKNNTIFKNGQKQGLVIDWFEDGKKKQESVYKDDVLEGPAKIWVKDPNGKIISLWSGRFNNNQLEGTAVMTDVATGKKIQEWYYKDGLLEGIYTRWYRNGKKEAEVYYKANKKEGVAMQWYENGQRKEQAIYRDDQLEGVYKTWYSNGQTRFECLMKDNVQQGKCKVFDEQRNIKSN